MVSIDTYQYFCWLELVMLMMCNVSLFILSISNSIGEYLIFGEALIKHIYTQYQGSNAIFYDDRVSVAVPSASSFLGGVRLRKKVSHLHLHRHVTTIKRHASCCKSEMAYFDFDYFTAFKLDS